MPKRIQRKRTKGFRLADASSNPNGVVYVGRPTQWGNPFRLGDAVEAYRALLTFNYKWFRENSGYSYTASAIFSWTLTKPSDVATLLEPLRGKDLACFCKEGAPCHADILLELANA